MTIADTGAGRDAIAAMFKAAWEADTVSDDIEVRYDDRAVELPDSDVAWVRLNIQHSLGQQTTLGGENGRRFTRSGVVTVQVFTPVGEGLVLNDALSKIAHEIFEGGSTAQGSLLFRNVTTREIGVDGAWFQTNVVAEFEYDVVR